jgi:hypothetical protein
MAYLTTLPVALMIQRRMKLGLANTELDMIWKEAITSKSEVLSWHFLDPSDNYHSPSPAQSFLIPSA